jgi:hypothetical protein
MVITKTYILETWYLIVAVVCFEGRVWMGWENEKAGQASGKMVWALL